MIKSEELKVAPNDMSELEKAHIEKNQYQAIMETACYEVRNNLNPNARKKIEKYAPLYKEACKKFNETASRMSKKYRKIYGKPVNEVRFVYMLGEAVFISADE